MMKHTKKKHQIFDISISTFNNESVEKFTDPVLLIFCLYFINLLITANTWDDFFGCTSKSHDSFCSHIRKIKKWIELN